MKHVISVICGDGIGPEIMQCTLRVLDALQCGLEYQMVEAGLAALEDTAGLKMRVDFNNGELDRIMTEVNKIPNVKATMQDLSTRGFSATRGYPIEFSIRGPDWDKLIEYAQAIQDKMKKSPYFQDIDSDYRSGLTEVRITPDRDKAFDHAIGEGLATLEKVEVRFYRSRKTD